MLVQLRLRKNLQLEMISMACFRQRWDQFSTSIIRSKIGVTRRTAVLLSYCQQLGLRFRYLQKSSVFQRRFIHKTDEALRGRSYRLVRFYMCKSGIVLKKSCHTYSKLLHLELQDSFEPVLHTHGFPQKCRSNRLQYYDWTAVRHVTPILFPVSYVLIRAHL